MPVSPWVWWITGAAYAATLAVGVIGLLWVRRIDDPRELRVVQFVALAFLASAALTTTQQGLIMLGLTNRWIQYTWPAIHGGLLVWGLARTDTERALGLAGILLVTYLGAIGSPPASQVVAPFVAAVILMLVWVSPLHRSLAEVGLWIYHLAPIPPALAVLWMTERGLEVWVWMRVCHLIGACLLLTWMSQRSRWWSRLRPSWSPSPSPRSLRLVGRSPASRPATPSSSARSIPLRNGSDG